MQITGWTNTADDHRAPGRGWTNAADHGPWLWLGKHYRWPPRASGRGWANAGRGCSWKTNRRLQPSTIK